MRPDGPASQVLSPVLSILLVRYCRVQRDTVASDAGITLTALNCNGNPLDPDPEGRKRAQDINTSIELAALLGVKRVVTMSGAPGSEPGTTLPVWNVLPWHSAFLRIQDYQWNEVAIPF
jgi:sugar phosphate isomerase/epimerase